MMAAQIFLISTCANSMAATTFSSDTSFAPDSTITMPSAVPTTMMFSWLAARSVYVGFTMKLPSISPIRTAPTGPWKGMSDSASAQLAPLIPSTSGSLSLSAEYTNATTWVSLRKASGNSGRMGRSICRLVSTSFSLGRPSRLMNPPGMRPPA